MRCAGHVARIGQMGNAYERDHFARPRCRWEGNIENDLLETGWKVWSGFIRLRIGTIGRLL
jgi:hypothetical protein